MLLLRKQHVVVDIADVAAVAVGAAVACRVCVRTGLCMDIGGGCWETPVCRRLMDICFPSTYETA